VRLPTLAEVIACNEAVREPGEASSTADDDDLDRVGAALDRAREPSELVDVAAALAFELAAAQGFYEGNKRTAIVIARWFIRENTGLDPGALIPAEDRDLGDLLIAAARGENSRDAIRRLLRNRAGS